MPSSTLQNPPAISYNTPGVYDITLTTDETLITESKICKQVVVISTPTVTVNSTTICLGATATLRAYGATSYTWSPSQGLSDTTGASVIANPLATTTYTVIGQRVCGSDTAMSIVVVDTTCTTHTSSCKGSLQLNEENSALMLPPNNQYYSSGGFTWECWFKLNVLPGGTQPSFLIGALDDVHYEDFMLSIGDFSSSTAPVGVGDLSFHVDGAISGSGPFLNSCYYAHPGGFLVGTWYHAAVTMDYSNHIQKLYLNGQLVASLPNNSDPIIRLLPTELGWNGAIWGTPGQFEPSNVRE